MKQNRNEPSLQEIHLLIKLGLLALLFLVLIIISVRGLV